MITVEEVSMTAEILEEIRRIDLGFYPNMFPIDWYLARYKPWHRVFAARDEERLVGYFAAVPIRKELYDAILNGVLVDDFSVNPGMFLQDSEYYYAVSVVIEEQYRGQGIAGRMLELFVERYGDRKTCLITVSEAGYRLAEHYFTHAKRISETVDVFVSKN